MLVNNLSARQLRIRKRNGCHVCMTNPVDELPVGAGQWPVKPFDFANFEDRDWNMLL